VRHLVELHGGIVAVASEGENRGAEFTLTFPLTLFQADPTRAGRAPRLLSRRVLLVEDDPDAQESLCALLEAHGAIVTAVGSVRGAREALRTLPPDVVVSDIGLPDEDGYTLVRELRGTAGVRLVPAIAVTGRVHEHDAGRALAAGYQVRLEKPIDPELLVAAIAQLTGSSHGGRATVRPSPKT
jgi:CheY-like chemotaxis protein